MKFSTKIINESIIYVVNRFPLTLLSILSTVTALVILIENTTSYENEFAKIAMVSSLSIVVFLNTKLFKEKYNIAKTQYYIINVCFLLLLLFYYYLLPDDIKNNFSQGIRFPGILLTLHLIASYIPYLKSQDLKAFTNYNIQVLLRFLESFLFVLVLIGSISLAIAAVENLFDVDLMSSKRYPELFTIIAGIIGGFYFLSNYPRDFEQVIKVQFNRAFGVLSKYIFIPIVLIYALILYAYAAKLAVVQVWPEKWMIRMSNWFFALGILTYLFNYAYNFQAKNRITSTYLKWFYPITLPLALALIIPIYKRFMDEGITEENYSLAAVTLWVVFISIYFIASKKDNIKILPISLSIIIFFSVIGPWNMFNSSLRNQWNRLEKNLITVDVLDLQNGLSKVDKKIKHQEYNAIDKSLDYIIKRGQLNRFLEWDKNSVLSNNKKNSSFSILKTLGLKHLPPVNTAPKIDSKHFSFMGNRIYNVALDSFQYFVPIITKYEISQNDKYLYINSNTNKMVLVLDDVKSYLNMPNITQMDMSYMANDNMVENDLWIQNDSFSILIKFHFLNGKIDNSGLRRIEHIEGNAFIQKKY